MSEETINYIHSVLTDIYDRHNDRRNAICAKLDRIRTRGKHYEAVRAAQHAEFLKADAAAQAAAELEKLVASQLPREKGGKTLYAVWAKGEVTGYMYFTEAQRDAINAIPESGYYLGIDPHTAPDEYKERK